jgi:WD40 repeat protein
MDGEAGFVGVWDVDSSGPHMRWRAGGLGRQSALALSPGGELLISGGETVDGRGGDNFVRVWYTASGDLRSTLVGHGNSVSGIVAPEHHRWAASTADDGTVRVWRYEMDIAPPNETAVAMLAGDPHGRWLATACDANLQIRDIATGAVDQVLDAGDRKIEAMAVAPDGTWLATAGQDRLITIWETATWTATHHLGPHSFWITSLAPAGSRLLLACDGSIRLWDLRSGGEAAEPEFTDLAEPLHVVAVAPGLAWFAGGGGERSSLVENPVAIRDLITGQQYVLPAHRRDISALASAPDGSWLASTGDHRVLIWQPDSTGGRSAARSTADRRGSAAASPAAAPRRGCRRVRRDARPGAG